MDRDNGRTKPNRRKLLRALIASGTVPTAASLPVAWREPVVRTVLLPAHAQTTGARSQCAVQTISIESQNLVLCICGDNEEATAQIAVATLPLLTASGDPTVGIPILFESFPVALVTGQFTDDGFVGEISLDSLGTEPVSAAGVGSCSLEAASVASCQIISASLSLSTIVEVDFAFTLDPGSAGGTFNSVQTMDVVFTFSPSGNNPTATVPLSVFTLTGGLSFSGTRTLDGADPGDTSVSMVVAFDNNEVDTCSTGPTAITI